MMDAVTGRPREWTWTDEELDRLRWFTECGVTSVRAVEALGKPGWEVLWTARKMGIHFHPLPPERAKEVGKRLRGARAYTGKTQLEVEEETGISHPTIVRYEKGVLGNTRPANWYVIKTLAACYGVTPEWILGEEE